MKTYFKYLICLAIALPGSLIAQEQVDDLATLNWVKRQSDSIRMVLSPAIKLSDRYEIFGRMARAYDLFQAVALVAPYCSEARKSAIEGMDRTAWIHNFQLSTDQATLAMRAAQSMELAARMRHAADQCIETIEPQSAQTCLLQTTLQTDARVARLDLEDGLASKDYHILNQKVEHAMLLLSQMQEIARNCNACDEMKGLISTAKDQTKNILLAANWIEINTLAGLTKITLDQIAASNCTP